MPFILIVAVYVFNFSDESYKFTKVSSTVLSKEEMRNLAKIKISDEENDPKEESFEVIHLGKMFNKFGVETITPVIHYCYFCPEDAKSLKKITRHWFDCHSKREEVREILEIHPTKIKLKDLDTKEYERQILRKKRIELLKHKGDYR